MKYKPGDKIVLKGDIDTSNWMCGIEVEYQNLNPKIVTIEKVYPMLEEHYSLEEISGMWYDREIIGLYDEPPEPINDRFEILDIRKK